jgi:dipeptidyl aminopeptidase/acylaminoacyl peptidase
MSKAILRSAAFALLALVSGTAAAQVDLAPFLKDMDFEDIKISPTGEYYAATVPFEDRTSLVVMRRNDTQPLSRFSLGKNSHVGSFQWVNDTRIVLSMAEKFGQLDQPQGTGELYAVDADGSKPELLVGFRVTSDTGTRTGGKKAEAVIARLIDDLPDDPRNVLIAVSPFSREPVTRVERLDVYTGRRVVVSRIQVPHASFSTDNAGVVRFANGLAEDSNAMRLFHRAGPDAEWTPVNDETQSGHAEGVLGFAADNRTAYLWVEQPTGPAAVVAHDTVTGTRTPLLRDPVVDPLGSVGSLTTPDATVGVVFSGERLRVEYFDKASREAKLQRLLDQAFPGRSVFITSATRDGKLAMVAVSDSMSVGDFYLFDTTSHQAIYLASRTRAFDPKAMGPVRPVTIKARDGLQLHGFLTLPPGSATQNLPAVVMPHGGPFTIYDDAGFNAEAQMLAAAGYAVLQVNFRGSGNYGRAFLEAGKREWGGKMQQDLTDATRWLVSEKIANPGRICIHGASYGAYAALMGVAAEPELYRCASGYVGVYDLPKLVEDERKSGRRLKRWTDQWIGDDAAHLATVSPNLIADRIKVPVFLAAGGEDKTADIEHTRRMEAALKKAGVPVQALYKPTEGHGFYTEANRRDYYTRLLAFLSANIGGKVAK